MRIIRGILKGKKIFLPSDKLTRPLRDMVKESIFNLLEHSSKFGSKIENAKILDLFSGSGSFGFECISRKCKKVTFVENYPEALKILKKNIKNLDIENKCKIIDQDIFILFNSDYFFENKFDIIFIDAPYKEEKINFLIFTIKNKKILSDKGIIIIHRHKKDNIEIAKNMNIFEERIYGISKIIIGR